MSTSAFTSEVPLDFPLTFIMADHRPVTEDAFHLAAEFKLWLRVNRGVCDRDKNVPALPGRTKGRFSQRKSFKVYLVVCPL